MLLGLAVVLATCQAPSAVSSALAVAPDGNLLLMTPGTGGLFVSRDGGRKWSKAPVGVPSAGLSSLAIDPHNPQRCLLVSTARQGGIFLSTDGARTWRKTLALEAARWIARGDTLAFDPTTYDKKQARTSAVYWAGLEGLYRSADGGESWTLNQASRAYGNAWLRHHPMLRDTLFAATPASVFLSTDAGTSFKSVFTGPIAGIDVADAAVDALWAARSDGLWRSRDAGRTWQAIIPKRGLQPKESVLNIRVSPDDPDRMILQRRGDGRWIVSQDGGNVWKAIPNGTSESRVMWSPLDRNVAWMTVPGGVQRSEDGGLTWRIAKVGPVKTQGR